MPDNEFLSPEDWETFDPMAEADAAVTLTDRMRQEEDSLFNIDPGLTYTPQAAPVSAPYDPREAYNQAVSRFDDRAALAAIQQVYPGERIIGVHTSPPGRYEEAVPTASQVQFEAQQNYVRDIQRGVPQPTALANWGPLMVAGSGSSAAVKPMSPYQQAQVERWQKPAAITPYQQAQIDRWERQDAAKSAKPVVPPAVMLQYKSLLADEKTAMAEDDARKANRARIARQIFEQQHPELGLAPAADSISPQVEPPTTTRTVRGFKIRPVQR